MNSVIPLLIFRVEDHRYALALEVVVRIVRAAEITPLPKAPAIVLGVLDLGGHVLPVLDVRRRFGLPRRDLEPKQHFLIARVASRTVALVIDEALQVMEVSSAEIVAAEQIVPGLEHVRGVTALDDGLVFIHDLEQFLSLDEAAALDAAMNVEVAHGV